LAETLRPVFPNAVSESNVEWVWIAPERVRDVAAWLKDAPGLEFNLPEMITAADYIDYFEMVYVFTSTSTLQQAGIKARIYNRAKPKVPSLVPVFLGADLQENEVYDLFGIEFEGHPHPRRIFMWDGFPGWPLRKDFLDFDHREIEESSK